MHNDELQTKLQEAIKTARGEPRRHDITIGQGPIADRILRVVDVNGAYAMLANALSLIAGKKRLRDCSEHELLAIETSLKNAVIWAEPFAPCTKRP